MYIKFLSVRAKNFLQIGNEFETFPLAKNQFTVIIGKNGRGKSTIIDMITYALFKKPFRKVKLGQLINNTNKKHMLVEIAFAIGKDTYVVRRGEKPKVFEIYKNGKQVTADPSITGYQQHLEDVIICQSFKTFKQINIIGKADYTPFMQLDPKDRRVVVEDILDSSVYSVMQTIGKSELSALNEELSNTERDISILSSKVENGKILIAKLEQDKKAEISALQFEVGKLKDEIVAHQNEQDSINADIEVLKGDLEKIIPVSIYTKVIETGQKLLDDIAVEKSNIQRAQNIISKLSSLEKCPHCMQIVDENHKREILKENQEIISAANFKIESYKSKFDKIDAKKKEYDKIKQIIQARTADVQSIGYQIQSCERITTDKNNRIAVLNRPIDVSELPDITELQSNLDSKQTVRDNLITSIQNYKKAIKLLGDDGIKSYLIDKYIPIINDTINRYLEKLELFVEFNLDSQFNETIKAINRDLFTYHSFSEGQKMRIDLAILLTWRQIARLRNSMSTNLFILDEITDGSLDQDGTDEFFNIVKNIQDVQNTIVISHKESTIDLFDNVIKAETIGNFTRYIHGKEAIRNL